MDKLRQLIVVFLFAAILLLVILSVLTTTGCHAVGGAIGGACRDIQDGVQAAAQAMETPGGQP
ncbi:MAG: hypothetical protein V1784_09465 [bacterium]